MLVADKVEDDTDQKALRQTAFIQQLEKKNFKVSVSLPPQPTVSPPDSVTEHMSKGRLPP